jgi:hypothetical protein
MGLRSLCTSSPLAALAIALSSCSSFSITAPRDGGIVLAPATTPITVKASPSMTALRVAIDGNDVTGQINSISAGESIGQVALPPGMHTVTASADVACWYCSPQPWQATYQNKFCVATQTSTATASKTALAKGDGRSWNKTSNTTVGVAADTGTLMTRWTLVSKGGFTSTTGQIRSTENTCLCMRSMDAAQGTPVGLALCDPNDPLQQWQALQMPPGGTGNYRVQNTGRGVSDACLTEGANDVLIQRSCNDTPEQLWSVRDNTTGQLGLPF